MLFGMGAYTLSTILSLKVATLFGQTFVAGLIAITAFFIVIDMINELYGLKEARKYILSAVAMRFLVTITIVLPTLLLPTAFNQVEGFDAVMTVGFKSMLVAELATVISMLLIDTKIFDWLKKFKLPFLIRTNMSNVVSFFISSLVYIFGMMLGLKPFGVLIGIVLGQLITRYALSIVFSLVSAPIVAFAKKRG